MALEDKLDALIEAINKQTAAIVTATNYHREVTDAIMAERRSTHPAASEPATEQTPTAGAPDTGKRKPGRPPKTVETKPAPEPEPQPEPEPEAAEPEPEDTEEATAAPDVTAEDVRTAVFKVKDVIGIAASKELVKKHGKADKLAEVHPTNFAPLYAAAVKALDDYGDEV